MELAAAWPQLEELRRAAGRQGRWSQALSLVIATSRVEMVAALHATRKYVACVEPRLKDDLDCAVLMSLGALRYQALRALQRGGLGILGRAWRWPVGRVEEASEAIKGLLGEGESPGLAADYVEHSAADMGAAPGLFPHGVSAFGAALRAGVPWHQAIAAHGRPLRGWFSRDGKRFRFGTAEGQPVGGAATGPCVAYTTAGREGEPTVTQYWRGIYWWEWTARTP